MQITPGWLEVTPTTKVKHQIVQWAGKTAQLTDIVDLVKLHVTLAYIGEPGWFPVRILPRVKYLAIIGHLELFGDNEDTLVVTLNSEGLQRRFQALKQIGYKPSYPSYRPHITIKENATRSDLNKAELQFYQFPTQRLILSNEKWHQITNEN